MNFRWLISFPLIALNAVGQIAPVDVRNAGVANSSVSMSDSLSVQINPASNAMNSGTVISMAASNPFLVSELLVQSLSGSIWVNEQNSLIVSMQRLGNSSYSELNVSAGLAKVVGKKMAAGIRFHYQQWNYSNERYLDEKTVYPSAGLLIRFYKNIVFGCRIENAKSFFGRSATRERVVPSLINSGLSIRIANEVTIAAAAEQNLNNEISGHFGCEYISGLITLRCGIASSPFRQSLGLSFRLKRYRIESAYITHPVLGPSASAALSFIL
jgi:hypothetical protein